MTLADFTKGQRVRYVGSRGQHIGRTAEVRYHIKSQGLVVILFDDNEAYYGALPQHLEAVT